MWNNYERGLYEKSKFYGIKSVLTKGGEDIMKSKKIAKLIKDWFFSDLDIEITARKSGKSIILILESNAWYDHTIPCSPRHQGDRRRLDVPMEADDELYAEIDHLCYGNCGKEMDLEETLGVIEDIEFLGFSLN